MVMGGASMDFMSADDAWYPVRVDIVEEHKLKVSYCDFPDGRYDETYSAQHFKDVKALKDFVTNRFRPTCVQLQDHQCCNVVQGMTISASFVFDQTDVRFYDAVVLDKKINNHTYDKDGNEECTCKFELIWLFGPNSGNKTLSEVEHICMLQYRDADLDPTLAYFLKVSSEKLRMNLESLGSNVSTAHNRTIEYDTMPPDCESQARSTKRKSSTQSISTSQKLKETGQSIYHWEQSALDTDLGGKSNDYEYLREASRDNFMLIDNLEKDLSPSAIVNFVYKHLSISCQAQLLPSPALEMYAKGIIMVESRKELQKLADFLYNPTHMIMSSRGRPWVLPEKKMSRATVGSKTGLPGKKIRCGTVGSKIGNQTTVLEVQMSDKNIGEEIQIFGRRTEEFKRGKHLRKLFMEYADHQGRLYQNLALEVRKMLGS